MGKAQWILAIDDILCVKGGRKQQQNPSDKICTVAGQTATQPSTDRWGNIDQLQQVSKCERSAHVSPAASLHDNESVSVI